MSRFDANVWEHILEHLGPIDLARAAQVSRELKATIDASGHWERQTRHAASGLEATAITLTEAKQLMAHRVTAMRRMTAGQVTRVPFPETDESAVMAAVDARGYVAASGGSSGIVRVWDLRSSPVPREVATLAGGDSIHTIRVSPDGQRVVILYKHAKGTVWNPNTQQRINFELPLKSSIKACLIDTRLENIVGQGRDRRAYWCRIGKTSYTVQELPNDGGLLNNKVSGWNGQHLLFKGMRGFVRIGLATTEPSVHHLKLEAGKISKRFDESEDGRLVALRLPSQSRRTFIWNLEDEKCLKRILDHRLDLRHTIFFSNPDRVMTASAGCGSPRLYDLSGVKKRKTFSDRGGDAQYTSRGSQPHADARSGNSNRVW